MKKTCLIFVALLCLFLTFGFRKKDDFLLEFIADYRKEFLAEELEICSDSSVKTYMDYRMITATGSRQYRYIREYMNVDKTTGFLFDEDGFIGVALGSYYGEIGDRYYFTLESGVVLPLVKIEEKADKDTIGMCYHRSDGSVIEFVIERDIAGAYFGNYSNGLVLSGNYNNYDLFKGRIIKVEKVLAERDPQYREISFAEQLKKKRSVYEYASEY